MIVRYRTVVAAMLVAVPDYPGFVRGPTLVRSIPPDTPPHYILRDHELTLLIVILL